MLRCAGRPASFFIAIEVGPDGTWSVRISHSLPISLPIAPARWRSPLFVALLLSWQRTTNLIAASTIPNLWTRHIADSLQLLDLAPEARVWADLGTGGGFPGLMLAIALADRPGATVHLIDSNKKKAAFLSEAQRVTGAPAAVHVARIEEFAAGFAAPLDVVTARAVAPLKLLLKQSFPLLGKSGAMGLFPKGQNAELELGEARAAMTSWKMNATLVPSRTDAAGRIVVIRDVERGRTKP
jgi:16S rRNA (guanine527-N7)-methyltransferase